jgi:hypothetical protein
MQRLLDENIINPSTEERKISNFIFQPSTDPAISNLTVNSQFTGDTLYDAVTALCELNNLGWKIVLNSNDQFVFSFYMGANRSYSQIANPYVVFSPGFENIINSNYLETSRILKTFTIVAGEGEGVDRKAAFLSRGEEGLARRELFVDARDISSNTENGEISYVGYIALLAQRGSQRMTEHGFIKTFDGEIDHSQMFIYGQDFLLGDVVQIVNEFGIEASTRLVEIIFSSNNEGDKIIPTFNVVS